MKEFKFLCSHPENKESARHLCLNIYRNKKEKRFDKPFDLERQQQSMKNIVSPDFCVCHEVYNLEYLYKGAEHVLADIAISLSSTPPESIVESMGSVIENIRETCGGI